MRITTEAIRSVATLLGHRLDDHAALRFSEGLLRVAGIVGMAPDEVARRALNRDPAVYPALVAAVTVPETYFFRHPEHFTLLSRFATDAANQGTPLRTAWSIGCATGEEAYSLALALAVHVERPAVAGSDICSSFLDIARVGRYGRNSFRERAPETVQGLCWVNGAWEIAPFLKEGVSFCETNLAANAVIGLQTLRTDTDVIFCRNVLLYLSEDVANRLVGQLLEALSPRGILLMGAMEGPSEAPRGFVRLDESSCNAFVREQALRIPRRTPVASSEVGQRFRAPLDNGREMDDPDALYLAGLIHLEKRELAEAELKLRRLLLLRPADVAAQLQLLLLASRRGDAQGTMRWSEALATQLHRRSDDEEINTGASRLRVSYIREVMACVRRNPED